MPTPDVLVVVRADADLRGRQQTDREAARMHILRGCRWIPRPMGLQRGAIFERANDAVVVEMVVQNTTKLTVTEATVELGDRLPERL
jgi:hypothetical protein